MKLAAILETILFVHGDPMTLSRLAGIAGVSEPEAEAALEELARDYETRGLALVRTKNTYQLGSHPDSTHYIEALVKEEFSEELSRSSLETVAIIAYKGPISRAEIDYVRGVNSSFALRNLLMRGLVERDDELGDGRAYRWRVSGDFLKHLGIASFSDLPRYEELKAESEAAIAQMPHAHE
ncbi:MAG: SMC-Scp complex subunit ScpB [Candidatus Sungbacteria bacterium]|uniref:SMC-Scp complex subunit ScpB n=1 Tax=Candidatus Sungiibacteriota bacterium TaxID=2750080 RepID=A0A932R1S2_9BACT|nr:SMC-Scp complex subunit ScpB [Candidatus Sungbacteria bacterium]